MSKENFVPKAPKEVAQILGANKEVTESDARKANPLARYWGNRIKEGYKSGMAVGIFIGGAICGLIIMFLNILH